MRDDQTHADPDRLDLSPLDPRADSSRFEWLVREIRRAATPELVRRQGGVTLLAQVARWRRPILSASGALALVSAVVVAVVRPSPKTQTTVAEALGAPSEVALWLQGKDRPTQGELLGLEGSEP